ncbi:MAG: hypothetical protein R3F65_03740 [bacterium]
MSGAKAWVTLVGLAALCGCRDAAVKPAGALAPCLPVPWDAWVPGYDDGGVALPPTIECFTTADCPPPLACVVSADRAADGDAGRCELATSSLSPLAAIEHFGVGEFVAAVDRAGAGSDYTTVSFSQLPADAAFVRCAIYSCPIDGTVIAEMPSRCLIDETVIALATTSSLTLPEATGTTGPPSLALSPTPGCAVPSCTEECATRPLALPATGFFGYCLAFSPTALVGATALISLDVDEIGAAGEVAYTRRCGRASVVYDGTACEYEGSGTRELGVCTGPEGRCCAACWSQAQCTNMGGTRCVLVDATVDDESGESLTPFVGYCEGRCEVSDSTSGGGAAGRDGGVADGGVR